MISSSDHRPAESRSVIRMGARLDAATRQKVDALARRFRRPRAAVLGYIMAWGLGRGQTGPLDEDDAQGPVRHLSCAVDAEIHARVARAAAAAGVKIAPWLRHMVRQITIEDFPASWQEAWPEERSHDSRVYDTRFMLRLDDLTREKLAALSAHFGASSAEVIRQLIVQAQPEAFPRSWQMRAAERRAHRHRQ